MKTRIIKIQFRVFALICFTILATISKGQEFEILFPSNGIPEGFETGVKPAGWESRIIKGTLPWKYQSGGYLYNPLNAFSGTNNAIFQAQSREAIAKLITPAIDLKRSEEGEAPITIKPTLVFWHAQVDWSGDLDELKVYYRENITSEWKLLDHYTSEVRNWTKQEILLPDAAKTSTCQIAFEGISNWGYGTCIDDVRIEERGIIPRKIETFQVKQYNDNYPTGSENNPFSYVKVLVSGNTNEIPVNSITLNYSGTDINDLSSIRLFHTRDSLFKVSTPLNATVTYNGNKITLTAPLFNLNTGTNYIWIALGIENNSTHGNMVDFYIDPNDVVLGTESFPLSVLTPNGTATIHESLIFTDFEGANDWTKTSLWEIGEPLGTGAYDATYAYSESKVLATNLNGNYYSNIIISDPEIVTTNIVNAKYYQNLNLVYKRWLSIDQNDKASVKISNDGNISWATIYSNNNDVADRGWKTISHNISSFATRKDQVSVQFAIDESNHTIEYGGWNIDNFAITGEYIHTDVGIKDVLSPVNNCGLTNSEEVVVVIKNYGGETVETPFEIGFSIDGGELYKKQIFNNESGINSEQEITFTFTDQYADFSIPGLKNLRFTTFLEGDQDQNNNTLTTNFYVFPTVNYPYLTSFESSSSHWYPSETNSSWQWGTPNGTKIKTASDGNRIWATALSQSYNPSELSYLESPCFDLSTAEMPVIAFDYLMQVEQGVDGLTLEYSIDGGDTWTILPAHENYAYNWYDTPEVTALGTEGWSVNKSEYVTAKNLLPNEAIGVSGVKFRFVFGSNASAQNEGIGLDMIRVYELPYDMGITELISPTDDCEIGNNAPLELKLENFGYRTVPQDAQIPIVVQVDGGAIKTETIIITADITQNSEYIFTTTNTFNLFSSGVHEIVAYTNLDIDDNNANDTLTTSVEVLGMPEFTLGPDIGVEDFTTPVTLDAGAGYTSYSWFELPDNVTSIGSDQTYDVNDEGDFRVVITKFIDAELTCVAQDDISVMLSDKDVGITNITNLEDNCEHDSPISPQVVIQSFRNSPFDGFETIPLVVEVDGEIVLTEDYTPVDGWGTLDETIPFTFTGTIDLSEAKTYNISIYTNLPDDLDRGNDAETIIVTTYGIPEVKIFARVHEAPEVFEVFNEIITTQADTLVLKATDGFSSYQWERKAPDETIWTSLSTGQSYTPITKQTNDYRVTVVDPNGCGTPETNNETVSVSAFDLSLISINSPTASSCFTNEPIPLSITLKNSGQDIYPIGTEIKLTANTPIGDQNDTIILESPLGVGEEYNYTFSKEYTFPIGLSYIRFEALTQNDPLADNNEKAIEVNTNPSPAVNIEQSKIFKIFEQNETYVISPTYSNPVDENDVYEYSWQDYSYFPDYTIYDPSLYSTYEVTVKNSFGCTDTDAVELVTNDLQISAISSPFADCELTDDTPVIFVLRNNGNSTYNSGTSIDVELYLNNTFISQETIVLSENLQPKATQSITLSSTLNLSTLTSAIIQIDISSAKEEVHYENNSLNKSVYALGYPSPNLGTDRDIYGWGEELDPGYYDTYLWHDDTSDRIYNAEETGTYSVTVTDFSGCPGSDEVTLTFYKDDIELLEVLEPASGCGLTNQENITYRVQNNGNYSIPIGRVIDVGYTLAGVEYPETFTTTEEITVGSTFDITLPNTLDLSQPDEYTVLFWVDMQNDGFENNSITQTINSYPEVNLSLNYADGTVSNVPLVLDAGEGYSAYQWTYNSTNVSTEQTYTANETGTYSVLVTDGNGCQGYQEIDVTILMPDYSIAEIISPVSSCVLGTSNQVEVKVANMGIDKLTAGEAIEIELWHNQTLVATESFTMESNLEPSQTLDITLAHTLDLSTASEHTIAAKVVAPIDRNSANDSLAVDIYAWGNPVVDLGDDRVVKNGSLVLDAGAGYESYLWQDGSSEQTFTVTETGNYNVTVVDENGCEGSDAVRVDVLIPDYSVSAILSPTSGCERTSNETITLEIANTGTDTLLVSDVLPITVFANTVEIASEEYVLTQRVEPEQKIAVTLTTKADFSQATSYEFIATVSHPLDNNTSNNTLTKTIEHYPNPEVDLGEDLITYDPIVLDAGAGYESYLWQDESTQQTYTVTETGLYHVLVTSEHGCQAYDEVNITLLVADYTVSNMLTPTSGCGLTSSESISIELTNLGTDTLKIGDTMPISIEVESQDAINGTLTIDQRLEPGQKASFTLSTTLDLSAESEYSISISANHPLDKITNNNTLAQSVEHYPTPIVDLGEDFEAYDPVTLDAGAGYETYLWQDDSNNQTLTATETGTYSVTVTNQYGCEGYDEISIVFDYSSRIYVANIASPSSQACDADELTVEISIENQRNQTIDAGTELTANYRVNEETVSETITLEQALEHNQTVSHTFTQKFEAEEGTHKLSAWIDYNERAGNKTELNLTVHPTPDLDLGGDQEVTLPYTIESGVSDVDYLWSTGATSPSITVDNPGEYWLTVTNSYGCETSDTITLTISSVQVIPGTNTVVTVFPNPADQWITVRVEPRSPAKFVIELISPSGQRVYSHSLEQNQQFDHRIDVNSFASGVYILRVSSGGKWITVRLVIQR